MLAAARYEFKSEDVYQHLRLLVRQHLWPWVQQRRAPTARRRAPEIIRLQEAGVKPSEIAARLGIGRASVYRVLRAGTGGSAG